MQHFFKILIQYKFLIHALFIAISGFGYKAYQEIPVDAFPDITPKQVVNIQRVPEIRLKILKSI